MMILNANSYSSSEDLQRSSSESENTEVVEERAFPLIPDELALNIFQKLAPPDLGRAASVNWAWNRMTSDHSLWTKEHLKKWFPSLRIIDKAEWEKYANLKELGISFETSPNLTYPQYVSKIIPALRQFSRLPVEGSKGFTLLTIPKGLTLRKLKTLAEAPKEGNRLASFGLILADVGEDFWDRPILEESYQILISNSILEQSSNMSASDQAGFLQLMGGYTLPFALEVATLIILSYIRSPAEAPLLLFGDESEICSRTIEDLDVGDFQAESGLYLNGFQFKDHNYGAAAVQRFLPHFFRK